MWRKHKVLGLSGPCDLPWNSSRCSLLGLPVEHEESSVSPDEFGVLSVESQNHGMVLVGKDLQDIKSDC